MKKLVLAVLVVGVGFSCAKKTTPQKTEVKEIVEEKPIVVEEKPPAGRLGNIAFNKDVLNLINAKCSPCHIPESGGNKFALNKYENVKGSIDDILSRVKLQPGQRGFMPMRSPTQLTELEILTLQRWKEQGMPLNVKN